MSIHLSNLDLCDRKTRHDEEGYASQISILNKFKNFYRLFIIVNNF